MRFNCLVALAPLALAACAFAQGRVYDVPIDEARRVLASTGLPPLVFGSEVPTLEVQTQSPSQVVWILRRHGAELMRYVADLEAAGEGSTRVTLSIAGPTSGRFGNVDQRLAENNTLRSLYLTAMEERVASALERRPFEVASLYPAMAAATAANIGSITARMDRAAEANRRESRENIEKAYRDEAAGRPY